MLMSRKLRGSVKLVAINFKFSQLIRGLLNILKSVFTLTMFITVLAKLCTRGEP